MNKDINFYLNQLAVQYLARYEAVEQAETEKGWQAFVEEKTKKYIMENNLGVTASNDLLSMLRQFGHSVPKTREQIFNSSRVMMTDLKVVTPGYYVHIGLEKIAKEIYTKEHILNMNIDAFIDGASLTKSSAKDCWVILIRDVKDRFEPILVGAYAGARCFKDFDSFIKETIVDFKINDKEGFLVDDKAGIYFKFKLRCIVLDSVAKAKAFHTRGVTGYNSCPRCPQIGSRGPEDRSTQFSTSICLPLRSDESFRQRHDLAHHKKDSQEKKIAMEGLSVNIIEQTIIDPMHTCDAGIGKRIFCSLMNTKKNHMAEPYKLSAVERDAIDKKFIELKPYFPCEFQRRSRSLTFVDRFKCSEFRCLLLYCGYYLLRNIAHEEVLNHFMMLCISMRIYSDPVLCKDHSNINLARHLGCDCIKQFSKYYGRRLSYVVHMFLHVHEDVQRFGDLYNYSAYSFETYIGKVKKLIKSPNGTELVQLVNRLSENGLIQRKCHHTLKQSTNDRKEKFYFKCTVNGFTYNTKKVADSYAMINDEGKMVPVKLLHFSTHTVYFRRYHNFLNPFTIKTSSGVKVKLSDVGIIEVVNLSKVIERTPLKNLAKKCFIFPSPSERHIMVSMLHGLEEIDYDLERELQSDDEDQIENE